VRAFASHLERGGHEVSRLQFLPEGEAAPLFCDLFDKSAHRLLRGEGYGDAERDA
jgi:hypothetical protein